MFRESDRDEMAFAIDLWSYRDVRDHAERILERLEDGTMPCDAPWDTAKINRFRSWVQTGCDE